MCGDAMSLLKQVKNTEKTTPLQKSLTDNMVALNKTFASSFDFKMKKTKIGGWDAVYVCLDGMCNNQEIFLSVTNPIIARAADFDRPLALYEDIRDRVSANVQQGEVLTLEDAVQAVLTGNLLLFIDGVDRALLFSVQGFPKHAVTDPQSNMQEQGSHEGFVDSYKDNATLLRRRLAGGDLCMENMTIGTASRTQIVVCYMRGRVEPSKLEEVKRRLHAIEIDNVSGSGCLAPFLEPKGWHFFQSVGSTERPDVFCAKLTEGKIGILVDGTPHALILPFLFIENFHTLDDYLKRPYYALFLRMIKLLSFITGVFLPGVYVAILVYHPEIIPDSVMYNIVTSKQQTPFPIMAESLVIHIIYEIVREAGLRMPKSVGHTVSIVGALIIGDAAVTAKLISAPMLIIVALTAITSAVISEIQDPVCVLRLGFIIVGGMFGIYGIFVGAGVLLLNICSESPLGVPFTLPVSPLRKEGQRDVLIRRDWRVLSRKRYNPALFEQEEEEKQP